MRHERGRDSYEGRIRDEGPVNGAGMQVTRVKRPL